jgi:hypothetical protein
MVTSGLTTITTTNNNNNTTPHTTIISPPPHPFPPTPSLTTTSPTTADAAATTSTSAASIPSSFPYLTQLFLSPSLRLFILNSLFFTILALLPLIRTASTILHSGN